MPRISHLASVTSIGFLPLALTAAPALPTAHAADAEGKLNQILAGSHRDPKNAARDVCRHPKEGLIFFGIRPEMTVVEIWPSGGWWTEFLVPLLKEDGK